MRLTTPENARFLVSIFAPVIIALTSGVHAIYGEDWPWFLGPQHTGVSSETDLSLDWSDGPPAVLWKESIGTGYSAPSVLGDRLVVHHRQKRDEIISCRSVEDGSEIWQYTYSSEFSDPYGYNNGPRCSPILDDGQCITLGAEGALTCVDLESGTLIWQKQLKQEFDLPEWFFGVGCSPILDGERLIVLVGGQPNSAVVAFNRRSGDVMWESGGRETWDGAIDSNIGKPYEWTGREMVVSYSSPIIATIHGQRHLLCLLRQGLLSLNPETGEENFHYWFRARVRDSVNAARPVVVGDQILLSAAYRVGSALLEVDEDSRSVTEVWRDPRNLLAHWSTPIHVDGFVYGFTGRHHNEGDFRCIRLADGKVMWKAKGFDGDAGQFQQNRTTGEILHRETGDVVPYPWFGRGSLIQVGARFLLLGEYGTLAIAEVNSQEFKEVARTSFREIHYPAWAAPVLSNGKLYLRSEDWLLCLEAGGNSEQ